MSGPVLTRSTLTEGLWEGVIECCGDRAPAFEVCLGQRALPGLSQTATGHDGWTLRLPIPIDCISDGVQTFVIREAGARVAIGHFSLIAGAPADSDLRGEVALLRAEIDMLKQAFRRQFDTPRA
jgi:hypothetical protein